MAFYSTTAALSGSLLSTVHLRSNCGRLLQHVFPSRRNSLQCYLLTRWQLSISINEFMHSKQLPNISLHSIGHSFRALPKDLRSFGPGLFFSNCGNGCYVTTPSASSQICIASAIHFGQNKVNPQTNEIEFVTSLIASARTTADNDSTLNVPSLFAALH